MIASLNSDYISPEEYLKAEELSPIKHEYRNGEVYAMAGASNTHVLMAGNLFALLRNHIRGSGCRAYISDTKIDIKTINTYYYPDLAVSCDQRDRQFNNFLRHPCLIIEVLSPTTEAFDRGDKFADYRQLESLREYVLISQNQMRIDCFRRNAEGNWVLYSYSNGDKIYLESIDFRCLVAAVYEDVSFTPNQE
ncbi:protein of unknown function DUF820 [Crinalium epipsammum PCC 9333]|uniref:Putative restriction endonuclease domain-containing protein n=1 Tax=Crinalium epipsammum PCC 9333 TaxID=1173022 RepID=K9VWA5_9CYAN|nr:Uma2 family endonuclease [Crinalium epipsammum]AFZ11844.1 protein of unknown function DUF820 [Crinalium epipsammum PCC 9333]